MNMHLSRPCYAISTKWSYFIGDEISLGAKTSRRGSLPLGIVISAFMVGTNVISLKHRSPIFGNGESEPSVHAGDEYTFVDEFR